MYSYEDRVRAVELYIKYERNAADTIRELGYPSRKMLRRWDKEHIETGGLHQHFRSKSRYSEEQKKHAIERYHDLGRSIPRTMRALGYPSRETLRHSAGEDRRNGYYERCLWKWQFRFAEKSCERF